MADPIRPKLEGDVLVDALQLSDVIPGRLPLFQLDKVDVNEDAVYELARVFTPVNDMAAFFQMPPSLLWKHFGRTIQKARLETQTLLRLKQIEMAMEGDRVMQLWLGKNVLGQSNNPVPQQNELIEAPSVEFEVKLIKRELAPDADRAAIDAEAEMTGDEEALAEIDEDPTQSAQSPG